MRGTQHREIGTTISTGNASWRGPNTEAGGKSVYKQSKLAGPNTEKLESQFQQTMRVGAVQRNEFCESIIFVPPPDEHVY